MTNPTPDDFIINTYYPYTEWLKFIQRNELGMKLHLLPAGLWDFTTRRATGIPTATTLTVRMRQSVSTISTGGLDS